MSGFISKEESDRRLTDQAVKNAQVQREYLGEQKAEIRDLHTAIAGLILSNGGRLYLRDTDVEQTRNTRIAVWRDERNRRWVYEVQKENQ